PHLLRPPAGHGRRPGDGHGDAPGGAVPARPRARALAARGARGDQGAPSRRRRRPRRRRVLRARVRQGPRHARASRALVRRGQRSRREAHGGAARERRVRFRALQRPAGDPAADGLPRGPRFRLRGARQGPAGAGLARPATATPFGRRPQGAPASSWGPGEPRAASQWRVTAAPALQPACPTIEPRARERPGPGMDSVFAFEKPVLELLLRGTLAYLAIVFVLRVIPKRHLSNLSPNDFIALVIIGGLTTDAIGGVSSSMLDYLLMAVVVIVWSYLIDLFEFRFPGWRRLTRDSPTLVVHMGKPVRANMRRERLTAEEL